MDGKRHDKAAEASHLDHIVGLLNGGKHWGVLDHSAEPRSFTPEQIQQGNAAFTKTLRDLVDQWIDSGKDGSGIEEPLTRAVRKIPSGYTEPLFDVLLAWLNRNMPTTVLMNSGRIAIAAEPPKHWKPDVNGLVEYRQPEEYARDCAVFYLKELLDNPGAHRVARCDNSECGRYYVRRRLRKKEIKRGTFCGNCAGSGSMIRTQATRDRRKQERVIAASDFWNAFKPTLSHPNKSEWVAWKVNKQLRPDMQITGKWVSQNRTAIEEEIERRSHAKS